jgi:anti-sigma factor RsiW
MLREEKASAAVPFWKLISSVWIYFGSVGAAVVLAFLAIMIFWSQGIPGLDQEAVANHVRSLQVNHLMDVASTDQHTVKPWFAGKLDYSPPVVDLTTSGYPLIGGRLDILDHREVAAIIYQRRKHYINLFIWPAAEESLHGRLYDLNGYHALGWTKSGMNYLAVSELGEKEFREFVQMIQDQTADTRPGE